MNNLQYCAQKAAPPGSTRYYSLLFASSEQRTHSLAIYALYQELNDIVHISDSNIAHTKLHWWGNEIAQVLNIENGKPTHPVTQQLATLDRVFLEKNKNLFAALYTGFEQALETPHFTKDLLHHIAHTTAICDQLAHPGIQHHSIIRDISYAGQIIEHIRYYGRDLRQNRHYFVEEDLPIYAQHARDFYQQAITELPISQRYFYLPLIIYTEIQLKLLNEMMQQDINIVEHHVTLTPLRKCWIAWRVQQREKKHQRKSVFKTGFPLSRE